MVYLKVEIECISQPSRCRGTFFPGSHFQVKPRVLRSKFTTGNHVVRCSCFVLAALLAVLCFAFGPQGAHLTTRLGVYRKGAVCWGSFNAQIKGE